MIRLMLASYSDEERAELARILEQAQNLIENSYQCRKYMCNCHDCKNRHLCTDLLSASVFAKDFKPVNDKRPKV